MVVTKALDIEQKVKFGKKRVALNQWFLTFINTPKPYVVFQAFVEPHFAQYNRK